MFFNHFFKGKGKEELARAVIWKLQDAGNAVEINVNNEQKQSTDGANLERRCMNSSVGAAARFLWR